MARFGFVRFSSRGSGGSSRDDSTMKWFVVAFGILSALILLWAVCVEMRRCLN